ncbi:Homeodomain-like protein [Ascosphaera apis ARSEF 7405]|uniref:Homeodomain-like protein n=1 Tax=Ascosphaera apis ARSEF 7405 TaxID=392613 RepID=A0A162IRA4_9EURO|nr:Homeodomain-like protein [Ascosphaera apis ARSEF 7405]
MDPPAAPSSVYSAISPAPSQEQEHEIEPKIAETYDTPDHRSHGANILPPISDERKRAAPKLDLPSPPVTPSTANKRRRISSTSPAAEVVVAPVAKPVDPVLFPPPTHISPPQQPTSPLFDPKVSSIVDKHIEENETKPLPAKPTRDEYMFTLSCVPVVSKLYNRDPAAWHQREQEILQKQLSLMGAQNVPAQTQKRLPPVRKPPVSATARLPKPRVRRSTPRSTPRPRAEPAFDRRLVMPQSPKPVRPIGTSRDDVDYNALPDYSPPIETLRGNTKGLKADWKGQMLDLSRDPDRNQLDPAEVSLAATLRLSCATYLCSKRRIFEARLNALRIGKEFRKTDAQQACKIDVNKASKLWTAYERVGWFKPEYFKQYL